MCSAGAPNRLRLTLVPQVVLYMLYIHAIYMQVGECLLQGGVTPAAAHARVLQSAAMHASCLTTYHAGRISVSAASLVAHACILHTLIRTVHALTDPLRPVIHRSAASARLDDCTSSAAARLRACGTTSKPAFDLSEKLCASSASKPGAARSSTLASSCASSTCTGVGCTRLTHVLHRALYDIQCLRPPQTGSAAQGSIARHDHVQSVGQLAHVSGDRVPCSGRHVPRCEQASGLM